MLLHEIIETWVDQTPQAAAFRFDGRDLTYGALDMHADALGAQLQGLGVDVSDRVGVLMRKSLDLPVALYGILRAGAAYVPIDADLPADRIASIIARCDIKVLITHDAVAVVLGAVAAQSDVLEHVIGTEVDDQRIVSHAMHKETSTQLNPVSIAPSDLAYIIFTSGSTGEPKGIVHTHESGYAYVDMMANLYDLKQSDRLAAQAPLHFDLSNFDMFCGPSKGACTVMVSEATKLFPASMSTFIEAEDITVWFAVPFLLIQLEERGVLEMRNFSKLQQIIFAGEVMSPKHLSSLQARLPHVRFSNAYGPAELNVVTYHHLPPEPHDPNESVPIGVACSHTHLKICEDGELWIATPAMMRGYWKNDAQSERSFVEERGVRYYRSGDVVETQADGALRFVGRKDRQIKLRGFRIELDEIELVLSNIDGVSEAAVLLSKDGAQIEAYLSVAPECALSVQDISAQAVRQLPKYAVPASISIVEDFGRTSSGKIDRKSLGSGLCGK